MADSSSCDAGISRLAAKVASVVPIRHPSTAVFEEDWWLDAVAPGAWDRVTVEWDGRVVGDMAFHLTRRWGLRYICPPHLTRTMSPRLYTTSSKAATRAEHSQIIVKQLLDKLPRYDRFERALQPGCPSTQGFVHANLAVVHLFTFRSKPGEAAEAMLAQADAETRRVVTKARRECEVERSLDFDRFIRLHHQSYGEGTTVAYKTAARMFEAASSRGRAEIAFVKRGGEDDTSAVVLVWDASTVYAWLHARSFASKYSGASRLAFYEAMRTAERLGLVLDLDGYVRPSVGTFLTKFGLQPVVRPYVNDSSTVWQLSRAGTSLFFPRRYDRHFRVP
ncbi:MAG TPA: hypothetical protein VFV70_06995 [Hyphomonadaceae bacterium]|nr:hypothetical protein [Hyphomonadaceae bacterium]